ncbi:MAG: CRTAC1 family protein, partial [Deltaproteobacteria bacterium]|nr:CRTAC1 family protein [Deltaproteobacteria bacterium]
LFHNNGDGTFTDVTAAVGMPVASPGGYHGRGVCAADFDLDGDPDIYVGNYRLNPNQLWRNNGGMSGFTEVSAGAGVKGNWAQGSYGHTIGPSFGDLDNDGLFDLVVPNLAHPRFIAFSDPTMVYMNNGDGSFTGFKTPEKGIVYDETHSGSTLFDADNDGDLDLFLTAVYEGRRSYLYANDGSGTFTDATYESGIRQYNGWGCAAADVDDDGDLDLVSKGLYINGSQGGHYLKVRLTGGATPGAAAGMSNRDAIGAWVEAITQGVKRVRQVEGGKGTGCQNSRVLHFGLGAADTVDSLVVHWPSGKTSELTQVAADQLVEIAEK